MRVSKTPHSGISEQEKRRRYFFAMAEANLYDATIESVCPQYKLLHDTLVELVRLHVSRRGHRSDQSPYFVLDIGCGTGAESLSLLKKFPFVKVVGVDLAGPMLDQLKEKLKGHRIARDRFDLFVADFLSDSCDPSRLVARLPKKAQKRGFDAVISAFTLHHFTDQQKRFTYRRIYDCLASGGVMLNGDLFNYESESPRMSKAALDFDVKWIRDHFAASAKKQPKMRELCEQWVDHYYNDNCYSSVTAQIKMLRAARFSEVANPFRYWQVGLLWGLK